MLFQITQKIILCFSRLCDWRIILVAPVLASQNAQACACSGRIFDVATSSKLPQGVGGFAYLDFYYQNQNQNWAGNSSLPASSNEDKRISTGAVTAGVQYFFNSDWGVQVEVPYLDREFEKIGGLSGTDPVSLHWSGMGDMRIKGIYTGFASDMASGVTFGLKLPTGATDHNDAFDDLDRDSQIGTGSTDILLGVFHREVLLGQPLWSWFSQAELDVPLFAKDNYRPGVECNVALGTYYEGWMIRGVRVRPVAQLVASLRGHDGGSESADPVASGYQRLIVSTGVELLNGPFSTYMDVELPVYQHVTGEQLVSQVLFKTMISYRF